jgi:hypothetical protein
MVVRVSSLRLLHRAAGSLLVVGMLPWVLLLWWRRRQRWLLLGCISSILRRRVLIVLIVLIVVAIGRRLLILAALVVRHFVEVAGVVERDRVAGTLRELVDAPEGSVASRLDVDSMRDPHGECDMYSRPEIGCGVSHSMNSIVCRQASRVVVVVVGSSRCG